MTLSLSYTTLTSVDQVMDHVSDNFHPPSSNTGDMSHKHSCARITVIFPRKPGFDSSASHSRLSMSNSPVPSPVTCSFSAGLPLLPSTTEEEVIG